ncbi:MAG: T9SS type A sorting domain-containing protein [Ferruginibacter sp.]
MNIDTIAGSGLSEFQRRVLCYSEPTTSQLTGVALTFSPGKIMVDSMVLRNISLPDQQRTEFEWVITATANAMPNTTYYFREWGAAANNLDIGMTYPSLTTAGVLPIKLSGFNVAREGKRIRLEWSTASEQNNDRFEVQRSSDGTTWKTIASIKGKGNSAASSAYKAYDEDPLSGTNFYIIRQYDLDGQSSKSGIKMIKMSRSASVISIFPNPSNSGVNFSIENKGISNMEATLTNLNGSIVHQEIFKNVPANSINKLNLAQQPAPGVYILKLKSTELSESVKIVIE